MWIPVCLSASILPPFFSIRLLQLLEWILKANYHITHYLDNHFMTGPPNSPLCGEHLQCFLRTALWLGVEVVMKKVVGPMTPARVSGPRGRPHSPGDLPLTQQAIRAVAQAVPLGVMPESHQM